MCKYFSRYRQKRNRPVATARPWQIHHPDRSQSTLIPLYKSLVRPHLEYWCSAWNPQFRKDIELIEGVQRRATKLVKDMEHLHYNDRLEHLGLMCLHTRRIRSDLIDTYKIINGILHNNVKTELFFDYDQSGRQGHSKKLFKRRSRLDIKKFAFSNRIVDRWNSLRECCVTCNSINCFKSHISSNLEPETTWSVDILESGLYMALSLYPLSHQCSGTGSLR